MIVETIEYKGRDIEIHTDEFPSNPREEFDNVGTIVHWHRNYDFGERIDDPEGWLREHQDDCIILPLGLLDHSGLHMWIGSGEHWCDPGGWDSGQVGWIYCTKQKAVEEWGKKLCTKAVRERAITYMKGEIEMYDQYLTGDVYGYEAGDDSCWGFYGHDHEKSGLLEYARNAIDCQIRQEQEEEERVRRSHLNKLKVQIKNHVPLEIRTALCA